MMKILSDLALEDGPIYQRFQLALIEWKKKYKQRDNVGDINVVNFLNHFGELNNLDNLWELEK